MSKSFPVRLSVMTFNVWGTTLWPQRSESLVSVLRSTMPDVILLQEVTPEILSVIDAALGGYKRIVDTRLGWNNESNIYWNTSLLTLSDHGCSDLEMENYPNRGLFWVRLTVRSNPNVTVFFSTAHFPWVGCAAEIETGVNQRIGAAAKACEHIRRLLPLDEPAILAGDFNDDFHPLRILNEELGFSDVFELLDLPPTCTHPARPSIPQEEMLAPRTLDWITCLLPHTSRVLGAYVKTIRGGKFGVPPSDHYPVVAIFEFNEIEN